MCIAIDSGAALGLLVGVTVAVIGVVLTRFTLNPLYNWEFARHIRKAKRERPELAPYIDEQTVAMGMGVIDAEG